LDDADRQIRLHRDDVAARLSQHWEFLTVAFVMFRISKRNIRLTLSRMLIAPGTIPTSGLIKRGRTGRRDE
jgi:hypothetical protein